MSYNILHIRRACETPVTMLKNLRSSAGVEYRATCDVILVSICPQKQISPIGLYWTPPQHERPPRCNKGTSRLRCPTLDLLYGASKIRLKIKWRSSYYVVSQNSKCTREMGQYVSV